MSSKSVQDRPRVGVLYGHGINADRELVDAFDCAGGKAERVPVKALQRNPQMLKDFHILAFPGGFSFGDHLGSGLVLAQWIKQSLRPAIDAHIARGGLVIGICNGFQVLVKMGLLPNIGGTWQQQVSLVHNESGQFIDSWVPVEWNSQSSSPWLQDLPPLQLPIRHGEGRFYCDDPAVLAEIEQKHVALRYRTNPNGSVNNIAGIIDTSGRVLGLMPHPEAFIRMTQHPQWRRLQRAGADEQNFPSGLQLFSNAVKYVQQET